eukprot:74627-Chlamydomonas_euryale.AAC.17
MARVSSWRKPTHTCCKCKLASGSHAGQNVILPRTCVNNHNGSTVHCETNSQSTHKPHVGPPPRREVERNREWNGAQLGVAKLVHYMYASQCDIARTWMKYTVHTHSLPGEG